MGVPGNARVTTFVDEVSLVTLVPGTFSRGFSCGECWWNYIDPTTRCGFESRRLHHDGAVVQRQNATFHQFLVAATE